MKKTSIFVILLCFGVGGINYGLAKEFAGTINCDINHIHMPNTYEGGIRVRVSSSEYISVIATDKISVEEVAIPIESVPAFKKALGKAMEWQIIAKQEKVKELNKPIKTKDVYIDERLSPCFIVTNSFFGRADRFCFYVNKEKQILARVRIPGELAKLIKNIDLAIEYIENERREKNERYDELFQ